jgi:hypothetical protein
MGRVECCEDHGVAMTRFALAHANPWRAASVAGVAHDDFVRFLDGTASLAAENRWRLREWASCRTSEVERPVYQIPTTTRSATQSSSIDPGDPGRGSGHPGVFSGRSAKVPGPPEPPIPPNHREVG